MSVVGTPIGRDSKGGEGVRGGERGGEGGVRGGEGGKKGGVRGEEVGETRGGMRGRGDEGLGRGQVFIEWGLLFILSWGGGRCLLSRGLLFIASVECTGGIIP